MKCGVALARFDTASEAKKTLLAFRRYSTSIGKRCDGVLYRCAYFKFPAPCFCQELAKLNDYVITKIKRVTFYVLSEIECIYLGHKAAHTCKTKI